MVSTRSELVAITAIRTRIGRNLFVLVIVGVAAACGGDLTEPAPTPVPVAIGAVEIAGGNGQEAVYYDSYLRDSLRVRVRDNAGNPISGVVVKWSANTGRVSPEESLTGVSGLAATSWALLGPIGTHAATATVNGTHSVTFSGHVRFGLALHALSIVPDRVNVTSGPAQVVLTARVTDDHTAGLNVVAAQFYNPTATGTTFTNWLVSFQRISGTAWDGVWRGVLTVPQGAEVGAWKLGRMMIATPGCASSTLRTYFDTDLRQLGMPAAVTVTRESIQPNMVPSVGSEENLPLRSSSSVSPSASLRRSCAPGNP